MGAWAKGTAALGYDGAMANRDPHDVLGVDRDASQATVKAAWRRLAREHHPDLAPDSAARRDATRRMAEINAAYQALRSGAAGRAGKSDRDAAAAGGTGPGPRAPEAARPRSDGSAPSRPCAAFGSKAAHGCDGADPSDRRLAAPPPRPTSLAGDGQVAAAGVGSPRRPASSSHCAAGSGPWCQGGP